MVHAELKRQLYGLFSQHGKVIDIVALRTNSLRGQAWVVFENVGEATNALRALQGSAFFDKPLVRTPGIMRRVCALRVHTPINGLCCLRRG